MSGPIHPLTCLQSPVFLLNSRLRLFTAATSGSTRKGLYPNVAPLLPKLRGEFAEFLSKRSLARLGILSLPTCVGLRYGHLLTPARSFSWQCGISHLDPTAVGVPSSPLGVKERWICLPLPPTSFHLATPTLGQPILLRHSTININRWCRNFNLLSITYAFRPRLRGRLTLS